MLIGLVMCVGLIGQAAPARAATDPRLFELRTYYAAPGKLDDLLARFRNHTVNLFKKHGMTNVGYWVPTDNPERKLIYILAFADRPARDRAFKEFGEDPEWQKVQRDSEKRGKLVDKVVSVFMATTDYSPALRATRSRPPRLFELRTYTAYKDKIADLNARFRDHTLALFKKHGLASFAYWTPAPGEPGSDDTLIYILMHKNEGAAADAWDAFQGDPEWREVRDASEAAGPILVSPPERIYMAPADFSPTK